MNAGTTTLAGMQFAVWTGTCAIANWSVRRAAFGATSVPEKLSSARIISGESPAQVRYSRPEAYGEPGELSRRLTIGRRHPLTIGRHHPRA
jgi:hypothetical protein